jgi:HicB-like protein involved in pilus formation
MALRLWWEGSMSANKTTDAVKLVLRLPKSLHRRLTQQAKRDNVSLNTEIVTQLQWRDVMEADAMTKLASVWLASLPKDVRDRMVELLGQAAKEMSAAHDQPQARKKAVGEK